MDFSNTFVSTIQYIYKGTNTVIYIAKFDSDPLQIYELVKAFPQTNLKKNVGPNIGYDF